MAISGEDRREKDFTIDRLFRDILHGRADFCTVFVNNPALLAFLKGPARHHLDQSGIRMHGIATHFGTDRGRLAEFSQQCQLVINLRSAHRLITYALSSENERLNFGAGLEALLGTRTRRLGAYATGMARRMRSQICTFITGRLAPYMERTRVGEGRQTPVSVGQSMA